MKKIVYCVSCIGAFYLLEANESSNKYYISDDKDVFMESKEEGRKNKKDSINYQNDATKQDFLTLAQAQSNNTLALDSANTKDSKNSKDSNTNSEQTAEGQKIYKLQSISTQATMSNLPNELQSKQVTVINKQDLLNTAGTGSVQSILERSPGILYSRSGGVNGQISFRGQNSNFSRSIVMIDGVRVSGRNTLEFNTFDPSAYDMIEIIRGPASALWGSDAMNGVVNFKSRTSNYNLSGDTFKMTARLRTAQFSSVNNLFAGRAELLGGGGGWDLLVGISGRIADDYKTPKKTDTGGTQKVSNSSYNSIQLDFNAGYSVDTTRYYLQGLYNRVVSHRGGGNGAVPGSAAGIYMTEDPIAQYYLKGGMSVTDLSYADKMDSFLYFRMWNTDIYNDRTNYTTNGTAGAFTWQKVYNNIYLGGRFSIDKKYGNHSLIYGTEFQSSMSPTPTAQVAISGCQSNNTGSVDSKTASKLGCGSFTTNTISRPSSDTNFALFAKDDWQVIKPWVLTGAVRLDYVLTTISKNRSQTEIANIQKEANGTSSSSSSGSSTTNAKVITESAKLLDDNSIINNFALTGSIGSVYFLNDYISNVINLSHNFRSPSAGSRMSTTPAGNPTPTIANPLIKPEYSQTGEVGFRFQSDYHYISLVGFVTNYYNMLALSTTQAASVQQIQGVVYRYENLERAIIAGVELEGNHSFYDDVFTIDYTLSYNYGQNISQNKPIAYIAPLYGQVSFNVNLDSSWFKLTERFYGGKSRIDPKEEIATSAYALTDIYAGVKLGHFFSSMQGMGVMLGIENLFNQPVVNPATYVNVSSTRTITNPLIEPGINFTLKYTWNY